MSATNLVPGWLLDRFNTLYRQPYYEASSYYALINTMLTTIYPTTMRFLVKPLPRLPYSPLLQVRTSDNDDFLVCIRTSSLGADVPILIYVVKREDEVGVTSPQMQVERYMHWARQYQNQVAPWARIGVYGVFVMGPKSQVFSLSPDADFIDAGPNYDTTGNQLLSMLQDLRNKHGVQV